MRLIIMEKLREEIEKYLKTSKLHTAAKLSRDSGVGQDTISRIINEKQGDVTAETWLALHMVEPEYIEPPPMVEKLKVKIIDYISELKAMRKDAMRKIPICDALAGSDCNWDDQGFSTEQVGEYIQVPIKETDSESFAVKMHGNSMFPNIKHGDSLVIVPSKALEHGCICFATEIGSHLGIRVIRRYNKYGDIIVLKPDNQLEGFEIQVTRENAAKYQIYRVTKIQRDC